MIDSNKIDDDDDVIIIVPKKLQQFIRRKIIGFIHSSENPQFSIENYCLNEEF